MNSPAGQVVVNRVSAGGGAGDMQQVQCRLRLPANVYLRSMLDPSQRSNLCGYGAACGVVYRASNGLMPVQHAAGWINSADLAAGGNITFAAGTDDGAQLTLFNSTNGATGTSIGKPAASVITRSDLSTGSDGRLATSKLCQFVSFGVTINLTQIHQWGATSGTVLLPNFLVAKDAPYQQELFAALAANTHADIRFRETGCKYFLGTVQSLFGPQGLPSEPLSRSGSQSAAMPYMPYLCWVISGSDVTSNQLNVTLSVTNAIQMNNVAAFPTAAGAGGTGFNGVAARFDAYLYGVSVGIPVSSFCGPSLAAQPGEEEEMPG